MNVYMSKDGRCISYSGSHLDQHKDVIPFLQEALSKVDLTKHNRRTQGNTICLAVDMERIVGKTHCVETTHKDEIVYATRAGRKTITRFVKNRDPIDCDHITVVIAMRPRVETFTLVSAWIGHPAPKEPSDASILTVNELVESEKFWNCHALIYGTQQLAKDAK